MQRKNNHDRQLDAVAIGTSAGGIEALSYLLPLIPRGSKKAWFVVQHITADSDSYFITLLKSQCSLHVKESFNTEEIVAGTIYFAPPDYHLLIEKNLTLALAADDKVNFSRPSIDVLFETAAEAFTRRLTGILLTGVNRDGSAGLKRIKELGGTTIVQSPADAAFSEMPTSAIKLFQPDMILTLKQIGNWLGKQ